jgi:hypothetical protein
MTIAALADDRIDLEGVRHALHPLLMICRRPPIDAERARHIASWLNMCAIASAPPPPTPVETLRAQAIEDGSVIELPATRESGT